MRVDYDFFGHHLVALVAGDAAHRREIVLGVADQAVEHRQRRRLVGLEQRQFGIGGAAVGYRPDSRFELSYLSHCAPYEVAA